MARGGNSIPWLTVDLGFAGRHVSRNPVHQAIGELNPGDALELRTAAYSGSGRRAVGVNGFANSTRAKDSATGNATGPSASDDPRWELFDASGRRVGRLSAKFEHPFEKRCCRASVFAVVQWSKEQSEPEFRNSIRCADEWEVVIPELVFLPEE